MNQSYFDILSAYANSGRFTSLARGTAVDLPKGERLEIRLNTIERSIRPVGLRLSQHAFVTEVHAGEHRGFGYGDAEHEICAIQKAIAEGFERAIFRAVQGSEHKAPTTNGWAAHLDPKRARLTALEEVLERDAVLVHWLTRKPMAEVELNDTPTCGPDSQPRFRDVLKCHADTGLFETPDLLHPFASDSLTPPATDSSEKVPETESDVLMALDQFLDAPFWQISSYSEYVKGAAPFATHQGVKGLEFPRVLVVMDDENAGGFLFSYEKLFGAKEKSKTDLEHERSGDETGIDRTRRLLCDLQSQQGKSGVGRIFG